MSFVLPTKKHNRAAWLILEYCFSPSYHSLNGSPPLSSQHAPRRGETGTDSPYERGQVGEQVRDYYATECCNLDGNRRAGAGNSAKSVRVPAVAGYLRASEWRSAQSINKPQSRKSDAISIYKTIAKTKCIVGKSDHPPQKDRGFPLPYRGFRLGHAAT